MLRRASRVLAPLLLLASWGCPEGEAAPLDWSIRFNNARDRANTRLVIATVRDDGCDGMDPSPPYTTSIDLVDSTTPSIPPTLGPGAYTFRVEARGADCTVVGVQCVDVTLPTSQREISIVMDGTNSGPSVCGAGQECLGNGLCRTTMLPDGEVMCDAEGGACGGGGTCHNAECCFGCWDGTACQIGNSLASCGVGGADCVACNPGDACRSTVCASVSSQPAFSLSPAAVLLRLDDGRYWARGSEVSDPLGPRASDGGAIALRGYTGDVRFSAIAMTQSTSCGLDDEGQLYCWGSNPYGALGDGDSTPARFEAAPIPVAGLSRFLAVEGGDGHFCAIRNDGRLFCWGNNAAGQLGIGATGSRPEPTEVSIGGTWTSISPARGDHTCAIRSDGALFCFGKNEEAQLGVASPAMINTPTRVGTDTDWLAVSAGVAHTCGIRGTGGARALYCWGRNGSGQVGVGSTTTPIVGPMLVATGGSMSSVRAVAAGLSHTCALIEQDDVQAFCWGLDLYGALGREADDIATMPQPVDVPMNAGWTSIAASWEFTCGVRDDEFLCWGDSRENMVSMRNGILGTGVAEVVEVPTPVILVPGP